MAWRIKIFSSSQPKQRSGPKYSIESGLCLAGMLLFWVCWSSFYTPTPGRGHAKSKSGYFSTRRYRNPPSPLPNFLNPLNWGGHLIGTGMWQLCQPCSNVNNQRHLHTLSSTPQLFWGERHLAHHLLPPLLFSFARVDESIPMFDPVPADGQNISLHDFHLSALQLFVVLGHLPSFSSKSPLLPFVIDQQLFPATPPWKRTRTACQMLGKNLVGVNWKQIHPEYVPWWGDNKSWWWHNGEARKQNCVMPLPCCGAFSVELN